MTIHVQCKDFIVMISAMVMAKGTTNPTALGNYTFVFYSQNVNNILAESYALTHTEVQKVIT